ncbi:MAG: ANTAR domain-containing protein [Actinomycetes bacterium]
MSINQSPASALSLPRHEGALPLILLAAPGGQFSDVEMALAEMAEVARVSSADDLAVRLGGERPPDVLIVACSLDDGNGCAVVRAARSDVRHAAIPTLIVSDRGEDVMDGLSSGADDFLLSPYSAAEIRVRVQSLLPTAKAHGAPLDRILDSLHDAVVVCDAVGEVLRANEAFTRLVGWRADEGPFRPPYPWWPHDQQLGARGEYRLVTRGGGSVWVWLTTTTVAIPGETGTPAWATILRDVTAEHDSRVRRAAAAELAGRFALAHDLTAVLITAVDGFTELFDGDSVVEVSLGQRRTLFTASGPVQEVAVLPEELQRIPDADPPRGERLDGILIKPQATDGCRAWVRFPSPRVISEDEVIVGSLLAEAYALAVERVATADRVQNLERAVESHRAIGQAIGILVERHRITPREAFARLSRRSQDTNVRVRDLAARLVETGEEA